MSNILIGWMLLTLPVLMVGGAFFYDKEKKDVVNSIGASFIAFVLPFWALYFILGCP